MRSAVWHVAALSGVPAKKFPSHKKFVGEEAKPPKGPAEPMKTADIFAIMGQYVTRSKRPAKPARRQGAK